MAKKKQNNASPQFILPKGEDILQYLSKYPHKNKLTDIYKAFRVPKELRVVIKQLLLRMVDEKKLNCSAKAFSIASALPRVAVVEITHLNEDGNLMGISHQGRKILSDIIIDIPRNFKRPFPEVGSKILGQIYTAFDKDSKQYIFAKVIKLLPTTNFKVIGVTKQRRNDWYLEPIDRKNKEAILFLTEEQKEKLADGYLVEAIMQDMKHKGFAVAKLTNILGDATQEKQISFIAIHNHEIPHIFSNEVIEESTQLQLPTFPNDNYLDWRDKAFVTIDPSDAKDHDDAVLAYPDNDDKNPNGYVICVAIADVAAFIKPDSEIDKEALERGNSVYFPDRVVPMLPERLSNNLCSLKENEDRPALCVTITYDKYGQKLKHKFSRAFIKSHAKLSYQEAQAIFNNFGDNSHDDNNSDEHRNNEHKATYNNSLINALQNLWSAYQILAKARDKRAPLDLDLPERKIILDENGNIARVITPERLEAHRLIEEFMIQANIAAAEVLQENNQKLVYRVHDKPATTKEESLRAFFNSFKLSLEKNLSFTTKVFNSILNSTLANEQKNLINQVILRSQSQAQYCTKNIGHFGLNLTNYAHFTSPIRRYSDLIVHRALVKVLDLGKYPLTTSQEKNLQEISDLLSKRERRAMLAERETVDRLVATYLSERVNSCFSGHINGVTSSGLFITLDEYGADGFVPISSLSGDYYIYDEKHHCLVNQFKKTGYQLGDKVEVRLKEVKALTGSLLLSMVTKPRAFSFKITPILSSRRNSRRKKRY